MTDAEGWICTKCAAAERKGYDDGQIPEHFRTCPKRGQESTPQSAPDAD